MRKNEDNKTSKYSRSECRVVKPVEIIDGITRMFPEQDKIELFARNNYVGWDNWGLEIPDEKIEIKTAGEIDREMRETRNLCEEQQMLIFEE